METRTTEASRARNGSSSPAFVYPHDMVLIAQAATSSSADRPDASSAHSHGTVSRTASMSPSKA